MSEPIQIGGDFINAVLADNARLREELIVAQDITGELRKRIVQEKNIHRGEIHRIVQAAGGSIETGEHSDKRRLLIEEYDYGRKARYRLVADAETVVSNGEDAHGQI